MQGKLIVIEGIDGSGKKTQSDKLIKKLKRQGYDVETADFPQYYNSFFGKLVAKYLRGEFGKITQISPYLSSILYAGDRYESRNNLVDWLNQGKIIVSNRYSTSNMAFMGAKIEDKKKRDEFINWIEELEYNIFKIPKPNFVLYLNVPVKVTQDWIKQKNNRGYLKGKKKDIHEKDVDYLKKVEQVYFQLIEKYSNWIKIDCCINQVALSIEEISTKVWKAVLNHIN